MAITQQPMPTAVNTPSGAMDGRREQMYPILSDAQILELTSAGREQSFARGEFLWDVGDRPDAFRVVLDGELEIVRRDAFGEDTVLVVHRRGSFAGATTLLSGRAAMVAGRAGTALSVLAIPVA